MGNVLGAIGVVLGLLVAPMVSTAPVVRPIKKEALLVGDSAMSVQCQCATRSTSLSRQPVVLPF